MFRPLVTLVCAVLSACAVIAQNIDIGAPKQGAEVAAGSDLVVQIEKPGSLTGSTEVAVVIGVVQCADGSNCPDPTEDLGAIVYIGPYGPERHPDNYDSYQNFTVTVPAGYGGPAQVGVAHFFLLGAGQSAQVQVTSTLIEIV